MKCRFATVVIALAAVGSLSSCSSLRNEGSVKTNDVTITSESVQRVFLGRLRAELMSNEVTQNKDGGTLKSGMTGTDTDQTSVTLGLFGLVELMKDPGFQELMKDPNFQKTVLRAMAGGI